ncbi:MAG: thiolase family protein [Gomphosphaeria aponina SAG 52.96 = DSM 107014]|uniref:acetyl-CoA C-acetyltransferase n=1 Tax=Gomphosphaeria aponina SAG 52.96 = DSM 107014 TaxID=1521640 RepID=A0A941JLG6_9CHRO|nr:thiolase family protein [Gomphosphaeria aponina SAG 52.96 = DSM 107014]
MREVYLISAVRTPLGRFGGKLLDFSAVELGAHVMGSAMAQARIPQEALDIYIMGNVLRAGQGQLLPRQAAFKAGIPETVNGYALDMVCSSGMMSLINAINHIRVGDAELVLAGGMESMSQAGFFLSHRARWGYKFLLKEPEQLTDILLCDGLIDATTKESMGEQAERLAKEHGFSRSELDEVALYSQQRATAATERGSYRNEIAPIEIKTKKGSQIVDQDEGIRADTTLEGLSKLQPAFKQEGVLTAGNCSQLSDGAAAVILASSSAVERYGLQPIVKVLGVAWEGGETWRFPEYPVYAAKKLLNKMQMKLSDFDLFENNEAFAISNLLFSKILGVAHDKLNVNGGSIALGHPIGSSGTRIVVTLLHALIEYEKTRGLAAICHGTGGGTALAFERV